MLAESIGAKARVLIAEDEGTIRDLLSETLKSEGYQVFQARDGQEAIREFISCRPDLVVLDILMPRMDGWTLLDRLREMSDVPVICLTALTQEEDVVRGLKGGASDYIPKPVRLEEFRARVETALRKAASARPQDSDQYQDGDLWIDFTEHRVLVRGQEVDLSPTEFRILAALVRNSRAVLSIDRLLDLCWSEGGGPENVRVYISSLRKKVEKDPRRPELIETVREFGYRYRPASL